MKKLLLILSIFIISLSASAADLNPFAYNLNSEYNEHAQTLTINFTLNAPASYVKLAISNGTSDVWIKEYKAADYQAGQVPKATYTETINTLTLPQGENLTWRVDVKGAAVTTPTCVKKDVRLFAPTSVDIDNNPENANFGTVFCVEGRNGAYQNNNYTNYISHADGAGLYVLNADGTARRMPYQTEKVRYGYNGGVVNKDINGNDDRDTPYFGSNNVEKRNGYNAYRVRVSDDGRIFITAFSTNGHVLWEAKKECFSATTQAEWSANTGWYQIMTHKDANTFMGTEKRNCTHTDCGIYHLYQNSTDGPFIAGPNMGFDVRGSGENLKLLMLSGCKQAIVWSTPGHFYCDEYDLGTATLWNTPPSRRIFAGHSDGVDIVNPVGVQVQYDKDGNVWVCQHRAVTSNTTLARVNRALGATQKELNVQEGQIDPNESDHSYRRCGAIRFNENFTQVAIASNANGNGGGFTVYPVDQSTGKPIWTQGTQVNTYSNTGVSLMDFAWDYAGNLYIAADATTNGQCITVYAMPHTADRVVSTPAASKYAFTVNCQTGTEYQVTTICNPSEAGTITCSVAGNTRAAGVLTLESCTELTVTATPEDGYKFLNWTDGNDNVLSTNKEFTFYVTEDITLKANFEYATYTGIVWKSLFMNGEDIADVESAECSDRNERLWRLFQVDWNEEFSASRSDQGYTKNTYEFDVAGYVTRDNSVAMFTQSSRPFRWLGKYMMNVVGDTIVNGKYWGIEGINIWGYYLYAFINRTNKVYNSQDQAMGSDSKVDFSKFPVAGQPNHWRPYWAEHACGLKATMTYDEYMPTIDTWKRPECPSGYITKSGTSTKIYPSDWYQWNTAPKADQLLAWRKGSPTSDEIVHHVYEPNMELHASYVDKRLQESDPEPDLSIDPYDATNNDVLSLLNNQNYGETPHNVTMDRKFAGGMYNTICLPFDLPISHLPAKLQGADIRVFNSVTETYTESGDPVAVLNFITLDEYWDNWNEAHPDDQVADKYMEAGRAYLIKPAADVNDPYLTYSGLPYWRFFDGTRMPYGTYADFVSFQGVLNPTTLPENAYILVADNRLAKVTNTSDKILGYRGYFVIDDAFLRSMADQGNLYFSFQKPVTTSIPVAPEAEQQTKPQVRKIMYDGKIYILRGDEVYTITGHRVK